MGQIQKVRLGFQNCCWGTPPLVRQQAGTPALHCSVWMLELVGPPSLWERASTLGMRQVELRPSVAGCSPLRLAAVSAAGVDSGDIDYHPYTPTGRQWGCIAKTPSAVVCCALSTIPAVEVLDERERERERERQRERGPERYRNTHTHTQCHKRPKVPQLMICVSVGAEKYMKLWMEPAAAFPYLTEPSTRC